MVFSALLEEVSEDDDEELLELLVESESDSESEDEEDEAEVDVVDVLVVELKLFLRFEPIFFGTGTFFSGCFTSTFPSAIFSEKFLLRLLFCLKAC